MAFNKKSSLLVLIFVTAFFSFLSCQKDLNGTNAPTDPGQIPDLVTTVNSSVTGFVTDENNMAIQGAEVKVGTMNTTTDKYGYFGLNNVSVVKEAAVVTVNHPGYFKGIKTYAAENNRGAFFRIKLIPRNIAGNINGTSGGNVTLANGMIASLPAG